MTAEMAIIAPMVFFISHKLKIHTYNAATLNLLFNPEKMPLEFGGINPGCVHLTEYIFLIITDVVSFQKRFVFIVKTPFPVMFFLLSYVVYGLVKQRRADGKSPIAVLPTERCIITVQCLDPFAAVCFDVSDEIRQCHCFWERGQYVDMVFYASHHDGNAVHALDDTADILENARKILFPHWNTRAFHMEHEVDVDFYQ